MREKSNAFLDWIAIYGNSVIKLVHIEIRFYWDPPSYTHALGERL